MSDCFEYKDQIARDALKIILAEMISNRLNRFNHGHAHDACKSAWSIARTMNEYRELEKLDNTQTNKNNEC